MSEPSAPRVIFLSSFLLLGLGLALQPLVAPSDAQAKEAAGEVASGAAWRLARSDVAQYDRFTLTTRKGKTSRASKRLVTVQGHDLAAPDRPSAGQYTPHAPGFADLPQFLALRLPAPGERTSRIKLDWKAGEVAPLRIRGTVQVTREVAGEVHVAGSYSFKTRGKPEQGDRWSLLDGKAKTQLVFSRAEGIVQSSRIELSYKRQNLAGKGRDARRKIERTYEYELRGVRRREATDRKSRVAASIEKGVAHLRTLQEEEGYFKPYNEWRIGTTALAILALVSAGVPTDDKQIKRALTWLFNQDPDKTYDRAAALMAIDRVYTPESELAAIRAGNLVKAPKRDLPPKHRAWVMREAEELMNSAPSPGAWGYPTAGEVRMKFDLSNTQYAVLGMRSAAHLGFYPVDGMGRTDNDAWADMWLGVIRTCRGLQGRTGEEGSVSIVRHGQAIPDEATAHELYVAKVPQVTGFRYATVAGNDHMSASMTCAGITTLLVARHQLLLIDCSRLNEKLSKRIEDMLNGAWAWLDQHWAMDRHPHSPGDRHYYYFLYCLERAGILGNIKRVGGKDWYVEGAEQLMARQLENGSWNNALLSGFTSGSSQWSSAMRNDVPPTCFALLFLQRGTAPLSGEITCK